MELPVRKTTASAILADQGKLPPQAIDFEEVVLGALMLDNDAILSVPDTLRPECFYKDAHQRIFAAILRLFNLSKPVDILTVTNELRKTGELEIVGGAYEITMLTSRVSSGFNIEYHCQIILEKYLQREIIRLSSENINAAFSDLTDPLELLDKVNTDGLNLLNIIHSTKSATMPEVVSGVVDRIELIRQTGEPIGLDTGLACLNRILGGLGKTNLYILAARPGMGKSALMLEIANHSVLNDIPILVFSLEMSSDQLMLRELSKLSKVDHDGLRNPGSLSEIDLADIKNAAHLIKTKPLYIDDTPGITISQIRTRSIRFKKEHNIQAVFVDYIQLVSAGYEKGRNREQEVADISRKLKILAKELDIPVVALSQLSRKIEERSKSDQRPKLSDLRESGAIEQDADVVMFIYSPACYDSSQMVVGAEIIVAKNRHGSIGKGDVNFDKKTVSYNEENVQSLSVLNPNYRSDDEPF